MPPESAAFAVSDMDDLVCIDCDQPLPIGTPIGERLTDLSSDGTPIVELACVYCAMGVREPARATSASSAATTYASDPSADP